MVVRLRVDGGFQRVEIMLNQTQRRAINRGDRPQAGFSLIELLIVVAIILIIAAIAIPDFLNSKMAANEASAVESIRTIQTAIIAYSTSYSNIGYPVQLSDLGTGGASPCVAAPNQACLIDQVLANGTKSGYVLTYIQDASTTPSNGYTINADPISRGRTGRRSFFTDTPGVIRFNPLAPATAADPAL
jgi:type IV pilus assembly protein PilA